MYRWYFLYILKWEYKYILVWFTTSIYYCQIITEDFVFILETSFTILKCEPILVDIRFVSFYYLIIFGFFCIGLCFGVICREVVFVLFWRFVIINFGTGMAQDPDFRPSSSRDGKFSHFSWGTLFPLTSDRLTHFSPQPLRWIRQKSFRRFNFDDGWWWTPSSKAVRNSDLSILQCLS